LDDDECVSLNEFDLPREPSPRVPVRMNEKKAPRVEVAQLVRDTQQALFPAEMIKQYDRDGNRKLSAVELGWSRESIAVSEVDKDGELCLRELQTLHLTPPHIELGIDVIRSEGKQLQKVISHTGKRLDRERYPDQAIISLPSATVTFSTFDVDPFAAS